MPAAVKVKERPISFHGETVRAILEGRKTQTRRVMKPQPVKIGGVWSWKRCSWTHADRIPVGTMDTPLDVCPYGQPGDRLWVKEAFAVESNFGIDCEEKYPPPFSEDRPVRRIGDADGMVEDFWEQCHYRATDKTPELACEHKTCDGSCPCQRPWQSPYFMPRWASRITLEITGVRIERLHEISLEDVLAEGVAEQHNLAEHADAYWRERTGELFMKIWDSINAKRGYGWDKNPWVWVIEFRKA